MVIVKVQTTHMLAASLPLSDTDTNTQFSPEFEDDFLDEDFFKEDDSLF